MSVTTVDVIVNLHKKLKSDKRLTELLKRSLALAKERAHKKLDLKLLNALSWPVTVKEYIAFLKDFANWIPNQYGEAWNKPDYDQNQEVYDRLCHFYWLIDQEIPEGGQKKKRELQSDSWFSEWLVEYANLWGSFLNTPYSFNDVILTSFILESPQYNVPDSMFPDPVTGEMRPNSPSGWLTFNQFFARELNPGLRPIDSPHTNEVIVSPADCTYKATYKISANSTIEEIKIKKTHKYASIKTLLDDSSYGNDFENGTFTHSFLGPYDYHRFHAPVSGKVLECRSVRGLVYLAVNISENQFEAPDSSEDAYEFAQARGVIVIDTAFSECQNIGKVAIIPVGMCQVSSVNMTATPGNPIAKGEEFGYFLFGGSDIIMLFQAGIDPKLDESLVHHNYGTIVGTCTATR